MLPLPPLHQKYMCSSWKGGSSHERFTRTYRENTSTKSHNRTHGIIRTVSPSVDDKIHARSPYILTSLVTLAAAGCVKAQFGVMTGEMEVWALEVGEKLHILCRPILTVIKFHDVRTSKDIHERLLSKANILESGFRNLSR